MKLVSIALKRCYLTMFHTQKLYTKFDHPGISVIEGKSICLCKFLLQVIGGVPSKKGPITVNIVVLKYELYRAIPKSI
jgi:hypothetical protein